MLKGIIQGPSGAGGQQSGSGVTSVGLVAPAEFISGPPVTSAGNLTFDWSGTPIAVAHGGTGMGSFAANSILQAGPNSTDPFQSIPLDNLTSSFLRGDGKLAPTPAGPGGTVTSVDMSPTSEFVISGSPITGAGTLLIGWKSPVPVGHGGTGMGSFAANSILQAGLSSTGKFQSIPLSNLTSEFLRGDGKFGPTPAGPGGTVTSVDLSMSSEFAVSGNPITLAGTILIGWRGPLSVSHGGTGMGSFGPGIVIGGLTSTGPLQGLPFTNLTSSFVAGDGAFRIPVNPGGTVQSVGVSMTSEFAIQRSPVLGSGTIDIGFRQPLAVAHGGTGLGSVGIGAVLRGGLSSISPFQGTPLTNLSSTFFDGTGTFSFPPSGGGAGAGTVTSVALQLTSEFNITGSPITSAGTLAASFAFQSANTVLIGPSSNVPGTPAFRLLANPDIPQALGGKTLTSSTIQNPTITQQVLVFGSTVLWNMNSGVLATLTIDSTARATMATPANLPAGGSAILKLIQAGTGFIFSYVTAFRFENNRSLPVMSSCPQQTDILSLYMDSSKLFGVMHKNFI